MSNRVKPSGDGCQNLYLDENAIANNKRHLGTKRTFLTILTNGQSIKWLVDTGAEVTVLDARKCNWQTREQLTSEGRKREIPRKSVVSATGDALKLLGCYSMNFNMGGKTFDHDVLVVDKLPSGAIMGADLLSDHGAIVHTAERLVQFHAEGPQDSRPAEELLIHAQKGGRPLLLQRQVKVPAGKAIWVQALLAEPPEQEDVTQQTYLCQGEQLTDAIGTAAADGSIKLLLSNNDFIDRVYKRGEQLGEAENVHPEDLHAVASFCEALTTGKPTEAANGNKLDYLRQTIRHGFHGELARRFWALIVQYQDVFSLNKYDLGQTSAIMHKVRLKGEQPVHVKQFRLPWASKQAVDDYVTELTRSGVITHSRSPYNSPIFCVPKKSGELRVVQDMRALNAACYEDKYSIREISECIDEIGRNSSRVFSTLDLTSGFWQLSLDPGSRECTAFTVPGRGRFEWTRCPMGLHGSPASFSRLMDIVMRDAKGIITYLDDVLVHAPDHQGHLIALETAFKRLRQYHLKLNAHKCDFAAPRIPYLGFTLTKDGVKPGEEKLKAIRDFPAPTNVKQIREFCGLSNYFRHLVNHYARLSGHLTRLLTKEANWKGPRLPDGARHAFEELKRSLCSAPVLMFPRKDRPFTLATDAATGDNTSPGGLGAVLTQLDDQGRERVVSYASRSLREHEKNYSVFLLEQLAASWAIDHYYVYLKGSKFKLLVDHRPMETLSTIHTKTLNRLQQQMSEYTFIIEYRPGKDNQVADALSRNPVTAVEAIAAMGLDDNRLKELQRKDDFCRQYFAESGNPQPRPYAQVVTKAYLSRIKDSLDAWPNGLLFRHLHRPGHEQRQALILPKPLQGEIIKAAHTNRFAGHGGIDKTIDRIEERYWWPNLRKDVEAYVQNCLTCNKSKNPPGFRKFHAPHQPLPLADRPGVRVHADLFGPIKASGTGKHYLLVITDAWSKYAEVAALQNKDAETVGNAIFDVWICRYGCPEQLVTDRGTDFSSQVGEVLYKRLGIKHSLTAAFHPQCNSAAESFNREIIKYMTCMLEEETTLDWEKYLPAMRISYNTATHKTLMTSPFWLTFMHEPNLPFFDLQQRQTFYSDDWGTEAYIRLKKSYAVVQENAAKAEAGRLKISDRTAIQRDYQLGENVLLYFPPSHFGGNKKFAQKWVDGYHVDRKIGANTYMLKSSEKGKRLTIAHADRIRRRPDTKGEEVQQNPLNANESDIPQDSGIGSSDEEGERDGNLPQTGANRPRQPLGGQPLAASTRTYAQAAAGAPSHGTPIGVRKRGRPTREETAARAMAAAAVAVATAAAAAAAAPAASQTATPPSAYKGARTRARARMNVNPVSLVRFARNQADLQQGLPHRPSPKSKKILPHHEQSTAGRTTQSAPWIELWGGSSLPRTGSVDQQPAPAPTPGTPPGPPTDAGGRAHAGSTTPGPARATGGPLWGGPVGPEDDDRPRRWTAEEKGKRPASSTAKATTEVAATPDAAPTTEWAWTPRTRADIVRLGDSQRGGDGPTRATTAAGATGAANAPAGPTSGPTAAASTAAVQDQRTAPQPPGQQAGQPEQPSADAPASPAHRGAGTSTPGSPGGSATEDDYNTAGSDSNSTRSLSSPVTVTRSSSSPAEIDGSDSQTDRSLDSSSSGEPVVVPVSFGDEPQVQNSDIAALSRPMGGLGRPKPSTSSTCSDPDPLGANLTSPSPRGPRSIRDRAMATIANMQDAMAAVTARAAEDLARGAAAAEAADMRLFGITRSTRSKGPAEERPFMFEGPSKRKK